MRRMLVVAIALPLLSGCAASPVLPRIPLPTTPTPEITPPTIPDLNAGTAIAWAIVRSSEGGEVTPGAFADARTEVTVVVDCIGATGTKTAWRMYPTVDPSVVSSGVVDCNGQGQRIVLHRGFSAGIELTVAIDPIGSISTAWVYIPREN